MDRIDQKILDALQVDGRIPVVELAESIGLSPTPCHRRIKILESIGIISGYAAKIDLEHYGLTVNAFVSVRLRQSNDEAMRKFESKIQVMDEVLECYLVSGRQDYVLRVSQQESQNLPRTSSAMN
ncbi:MAG: Lrp/AsnC family transcriptional regulator [Woeseiaceae bacterium]|nr:Lrp/AsnC family transcriptional regulator [Woeseiaceae bacterium]